MKIKWTAWIKKRGLTEKQWLKLSTYERLPYLLEYAVEEEIFYGNDWVALPMHPNKMYDFLYQAIYKWNNQTVITLN